jgi:hypothetical protein
MVGIPTNVCSVSLILVCTNWLQNGLASKVAASQQDGQGSMPGRPKYFCLSLFATSGLSLCPMQVTVQVGNGYLSYGVKQLEQEADHLTICLSCHIRRRVKNYPQCRYVLQLAILLVGHDKIHMVASSPTTVVQV